MKIKNSIVTKISTWFVISISVLATVAIVIFYLSLKGALESKDHDVIKERLQMLQTVIEKKPNPLEAIKHRIESEWASVSYERLYLRLRGMDGRVISISPETPFPILTEVFSDTLKVQEPDSAAHGLRFEKVNSSEGHYLLSSQALRMGKDWISVDLALDLSDEEAVLSVLRVRLITIVAFVLLASLLFGRRLAEASLKPVLKIVERASEIRSSNLHERLDTENLPSELELLVTTFNGMLDRLGDSFERLSQFSSDIAHELRTPVNNIRGEIEVSLSRGRTHEEYQDVLSSSLEELDRITKIIDGLLFLAKAENPATQLTHDVIPLREELEKIAEFYESAATDAQLSIRVEAEKEVNLKANRVLFQRAVGNLISNAICHTPRGGSIVLKGREQGEFTEIRVEDNGEGIPAEHLGKIFNRFYRIDRARSGAGASGFGLGLAIVKGILKLHFGKVDAGSEIGKGTYISIFFPRKSA